MSEIKSGLSILADMMGEIGHLMMMDALDEDLHESNCRFGAYECCMGRGPAGK
jgi:hypothetical protein